MVERRHSYYPIAALDTVSQLFVTAILAQLMNIQTVKLPYPERDTEGLAKSQNGTFFSYEGAWAN